MYQFNIGTIELPKEWKDMTIHVFKAGGEESDGLGFTISQDTKPWGMLFKEFVSREIGRINQQFGHFKEIERQEKKIDHHEAIATEFTWKSNRGVIHQIMYFIDTNNDDTVLIVNATMLDVLSENQKKFIDSIVHTLTIKP